MTIETATRRVATYERVSSEDQRDRETIKTQTDEIARQLDREPGVILVERYVDDGVSGMTPMAERPAGGRLLDDAAAGKFEELWVYKVDRLGRAAVDLLIVRRRLDEFGVKLVSVVEGAPDLLGYDVQAVVADHHRREFLRRSADGMSRAAREGRYTGGIVAYGYRVEGTKQAARHVADDTLVFGDLSAATVVRRIYEWLGVHGWSCRRIADELNALGIPTHYARDGRHVQRGLRRERTRGVWRPGRIRNMVVNPMYRGELRYGRRTQKRDREVIAASVEPLVSAELWRAAQETLDRNRTIARNTRRAYLLRGVIRCGIDGLTYCGSQGRDAVGWYRCTGQIVERGPLPGRCWGKAIRTDAIEPIIWADIEAFLRNPGEALDELQLEHGGRGAVAEADSVTLTRALGNLAEQEARAVDLAIRGVLAEAQLRPQLDRIEAERVELERRLTALERPPNEVPTPEVVDLLADVRRALDAGLSIEQRQEIVRLLAQVVVHTETAEDGKKTATAVVQYRFPAVVETRTGTDSSPRPAGSEPET